MNNLRKRRKEMGLSQVELSIKGKIPFHIVQRYETSPPRKAIKYALQLSKALEADIEYLFHQ